MINSFNCINKNAITYFNYILEKIVPKKKMYSFIVPVWIAVIICTSLFRVIVGKFIYSILLKYLEAFLINENIYEVE